MTCVLSFDHLTAHLEELHAGCGEYLLFDACTVNSATNELRTVCADAKCSYVDNKEVFLAACALSRTVDKLLDCKVEFSHIKVDEYDRAVHRFLYGRDSYSESFELTFDTGESVLVFNENFPSEVDFIEKSWYGHQHFYFVFDSLAFRNTLCSLFDCVKELHKTIVLTRTCSNLQAIIERRLQEGGNNALLILATSNIEVDSVLFDNFVDWLWN